MIKIYTISGLGADSRMFDFLELKGECVHLDWIPPQNKESLPNYARRMAEKIDFNEDFILIGLSFGGMVATEIAKIHPPKKLILISSAATKNELRSIYRAVGKTQIHQIIPSTFIKQDPKLLAKIFGTKHVKLLAEIVQDSPPELTKAFIHMIVTWNNTETPKNMIRIHGTKDLVLPCPKKAELKVKEGGHLIILDNHQEISTYINEIIKDLKRAHQNEQAHEYQS